MINLTITNISGMSSSEKPRGGRVKVVPSRGPSNRFLTAGIWLNNNYLQTTDGLAGMIENTLEYPLRLAWLDLSFNKIDIINDASIKIILLMFRLIL